MTEASQRRRRRSGAGFAPLSSGKTRSQGPSLKAAVLLGLAPTVLFTAHLTFGANTPVAALWLAVILVLGLIVALAIRTTRESLYEVRMLLPVVVLFALTVGVAVWTLTPWAPGGAHPIWAWAGISEGSITVNRPATLVEIAKLLGLACIFLVGCLQSARQSMARTTFRAVLLLGAGYGLISLLSFFTAAQFVGGGRLSGGFLSPNSGATVFGMLTVIGLASLLRDWRQTQGLDVASALGKVSVSLACMLLSATCLLLTASRMGMVATLAGGLMLMVWEIIDARRQRLPLLIAGGVLLLVTGVLAFGGNDLLWDRLGSVGDDRAVRDSIFAAHWQAFLDSPLFGYGLGSFADVNSQIMTHANYQDLWSLRAVHNVYLQWLEEAGLIGALPMFLLIATIVGTAVVRSFSLSKGQTLARGIIAANVVVLVHGSVDFGLQVPSIAAFWAFLLGCQFAFGRR